MAGGFRGKRGQGGRQDRMAREDMGVGEETLTNLCC